MLLAGALMALGRAIDPGCAAVGIPELIGEGEFNVGALSAFCGMIYATVNTFMNMTAKSSRGEKMQELAALRKRREALEVGIDAS